jgi:hypothetical protein
MKIPDYRPTVPKPRAADYARWGFAFAANAAVAFVWCVFLAAAAGNSNHAAGTAIILSVLSGGAPLVASIVFLSRGNTRHAFWAPFATLPMLVVSLLLFGGLLGG